MDSRRVTRALERGLVLAGRVRRVAPGRWVVPSQSGAGAHEVTVAGAAGLQCDCIAYGRGLPCAHVGAVGVHLAYGPYLAQAGPQEQAGRGEAALVA